MAETDDKKDYLDYYKKVKAKGGKPIPYGTWSKGRKKPSRDVGGGSTQYKKQAGSLSDDDYEAISKLR